LEIKIIIPTTQNKLENLLEAVYHIGNQPGIIFCNFKDTIEEVSDFLIENGVAHGCFYGGMEQKDRERTLVKFRNGTHQLIIATDLAARGIDVPEIKFIIHYQLPQRSQEFTHRNGRTARMNANGTAYILQNVNKPLPDFVNKTTIERVEKTKPLDRPVWKTIYISGGRRDKISKGDIAGLFFKQGQLNKDQLGIIEIKQDCAFVAVQASEVRRVIQATNNTKLKKKKVRTSEI